MSIGEVLAAARLQAGLTVTQVSQRTRIRETIIRGIERDDFSACGGDFYARGHIRAIARATGADPEPLVAGYHSSQVSPQASTAAGAPEPPSPLRRRRRKPSGAAGLLVVLTAPAGLSTRFWRSAARIAARAAIVTLGLHRNAGFAAAGLLAAGAAIAAQAEAYSRARHGESSNLAGVLAAALALAAILMCLLGLAAGHRLR